MIADLMNRKKPGLGRAFYDEATSKGLMVR